MATIDPLAVTGRRPAPLRIHDPATDELVAEVAQADDRAAARALRELAEAAPRWRDRPAGDRAAGLRTWSRALAEHEEELARLVTRETGRPLREALAGVRAGVEGVAQYAESASGIAVAGCSAIPTPTTSWSRAPSASRSSSCPGATRSRSRRAAWQPAS